MLNQLPKLSRLVTSQNLLLVTSQRLSPQMLKPLLPKMTIVVVVLVARNTEKEAVVVVVEVLKVLSKEKDAPKETSKEEVALEGYSCKKRTDA